MAKSTAGKQPKNTGDAYKAAGSTGGIYDAGVSAIQGLDDLGVDFSGV